MDQVTPNFSNVTVRTYKITGSKIECFEVLDKDILDGTVIQGRSLFSLNLKDEKTAKMLMDDLYYGEYTGS